jgi:hypothetical protein
MFKPSQTRELQIIKPGSLGIRAHWSRQARFSLREKVVSDGAKMHLAKVTN